VNTDDCARWLQHHYDAVTPAVAQSLNGALLLHGMEPVPHAVCTHFGEIMQDVDDIVNFAERREDAGENDDIKLGVVTHLMLSTLRADPSSAERVEALWRPYRAINVASREELSTRWKSCEQLTVAEYRDVAARIGRHGVTATVRKVLADAEACTAAAPEALRPCVRDMVLTFADRLRTLDQLDGEMERAVRFTSGTSHEAALAGAP
jgi:hypothetical protein